MEATVNQQRSRYDRHAQIDRLLAISMVSKRLAQKLALQEKRETTNTKGGYTHEPHERTGRRYHRIT